MGVIIPQLSGVHTRIGTCDSSASLSKISFSIPESTGDFSSFAGFTFCFRRRLQTLDLLETTVKKKAEKKVGEKRVQAYQLSQEVTRRGRFLWP
jgi:hypothetical protein